MHSIYSFIKQLVLAGALVLSSTAAVAGPTYHVTLDTAPLLGTAANLDFSFGSFGDAAPVTATLFNFSGDYGVEADRLGNVTGGVDSSATFLNTGGVNYLTYLVTLGGTYQFDVTFDDGLLDPETAIFAVTLYDLDFNVIGAAPAVQFTLLGALDGVTPLPVLDLGPGATSGEVPEPSQLLLMLTALALLGFMARRRSAK